MVPLALQMMCPGRPGDQGRRGVLSPSHTERLLCPLPKVELLAANGLEGTLRPLAQQAAGPALGVVTGVAVAPGVSILAWRCSDTLALVRVMGTAGDASETAALYILSYAALRVPASGKVHRRCRY